MTGATLPPVAALGYLRKECCVSMFFAVLFRNAPKDWESVGTILQVTLHAVVTWRKLVQLFRAVALFFSRHPLFRS